jgi:hypothetical protein
MERMYVGPNGRRWTVSPRPYVRKDESGHVTLELVSDAETRVVSCPREMWESADVDFATLLLRSVPSGAGRNIMSPHGNSAP